MSKGPAKRAESISTQLDRCAVIPLVDASLVLNTRRAYTTTLEISRILWRETSLEALHATRRVLSAI